MQCMRNFCEVQSCVVTVMVSTAERIIAASSPYAVLGLAEQYAAPNEVKAAYHAQSLLVHPDKCSSTMAACEQAFARLRDAREQLRDFDQQHVLLQQL